MRDELVNGVFEGGGAKGLVYVGALETCEDQGLRFGAVSGSSAGAITALLVACGYSAEDTKKKMPEALACLGGQGRAVMAFGRRSLLSSKRLREWLAETVAAKIRPDLPVSRERTFTDLRAETEISLYVITMDLASKQPLVFSPDLTPDASVVDAVVASAAIPVAFPTQRVEVGGEFRRLADGGSWANYPAFVFLDEDFRRAHTLLDGADGRRVIGFVLDSTPPVQVASPESTVRGATERGLSSDRGAAEREMRLFGGLVTSPVLRTAALALPPLMIVIGFSWFPRELEEGLPTVGLLPDGLEELALVLLVLLYSFLTVYAGVLALIALRFARSIVDEGVVATSAAMGVGPNVPYWFGALDTGSPTATYRYEGHGPRHVPVRLLVPSELKTLTARPGDDVTERALEVGRDTTARVLRGSGSSPVVTPDTDAAKPPKKPWSPPPWLSIPVFWGGFLLCLRLSFEVIEAADRWEFAVLPFVGLFAVGLVLLVFHGLVRIRYASVTRDWMRRQSSVVLVGLASVAVVAGGWAAIMVFSGDGDVLSTRERLRTEPVEGMVLDVLDDGTGLEIDVAIDPGAVAGDESLTDLHGDDVWPCGDEQGDLDCLNLVSDWEFSTGEPVLLWYHPDKAVIFLDEDRWEFAGESAVVPVIAIALLVFAYRCWRAYQWRRQHAQG